MNVTIAIMGVFGDTLLEILEGPAESVAIALQDWGVNATVDEVVNLAVSGGAISSDDINASYSAVRYADCA